MTKTQKMNVFLTVVSVIAIIATVAEIISCLEQTRTLDWLPIGATFSSLAIAFSSLNEKKAAEVK